MKILGSQVYTAGSYPLRSDAPAPDQQGLDAGRILPADTSEPSGRDADPNATAREPVQATPVEPRRDVTRISGLSATAKQYALYADTDPMGATSTQQKALSAYRETQNLSRIDSNIDYLGSIDIRV